MEKQTENRLMDMRRGEERVTWKLTFSSVQSLSRVRLPYVKLIAEGNLLCGSGNSNSGSVST